MAVQALFDNVRRREVQDALRRGEVGALLRRRKPVGDSNFKNRFGHDQELPLGMLIKISGIGFRLMGSENGYAVIKIERQAGGYSELIRLESGKKKGISLAGDDGGNGHNFVLSVLEAPDPSGQMFMTARVTEMLGD